MYSNLSAILCIPMMHLDPILSHPPAVPYSTLAIWLQWMVPEK